VAHLFEALPYKPKGREFGFRFIYLILPASLWPWVQPRL
jgi:hypothetical protein